MSTREQVHATGQAILPQAHAEVESVRPDVHILFPFQRAFAPLLVFLLPSAQQVRDGRRRQPSGFRPQHATQRLGEIARGQTLQIQDRQCFLQLRRTTHVGRKNLAREPLSRPAVVDPRGAQLDRARSQHHRAFPPLAIAHHQRMPSCVPRGTQLGDVFLDFPLQRLHDQATCSFTRQLIQRLGDFRRCPFRSIGDILQHSDVSFPRPLAGPLGLSTPGYAASLCPPIHNFRLYLQTPCPVVSLSSVSDPW
jgi:hypothetical protein